MSRSASTPKPPRAPRLCTLWTHDDNFSKEELVFNAEKFPELPTAPGTLLQIVALRDNISARDHNNEAYVKRGNLKDAFSESHSNRPRRGSIPALADENGSTVPGSANLDADKAYVFMTKALPPDMKTKHPNLQVGYANLLYSPTDFMQVSINEKIAKVFGFRNRMQIIVAEVWAHHHT